MKHQNEIILSPSNKMLWVI